MDLLDSDSPLQPVGPILYFRVHHLSDWWICRFAPSSIVSIGEYSKGLCSCCLSYAVY